MHSYDRGTSLSARQRNWSQIERVRGGKKIQQYNEPRRDASVITSAGMWLTEFNMLYFLLFWIKNDNFDVYVT